MAEVKDKIVNVESLNALHQYDENTFFKKTGGTITGTTVFSKVQDAASDAYNEPAVVIGGEPTTYHIEIDNNEIKAKKNETESSNLYLNGDGGKVGIGGDGLEIADGGSVFPEVQLKGSIGTSALPWNNLYGRYFELYGDADTQYGRFRVGTTGTTEIDGTATLELGNNIASGTEHNASGKITMYGNGVAFTNILPSERTEGSNAVTLPTQSGTLAISKNGSYQGYSGSGVVDNPITLQFGFGANIVFIWTPSETGYPYGLFFRGSNGIFFDGSGTSKVLKTAWGNTSIQWYSDDGAEYALSGANKTYYYMAL